MNNSVEISLSTEFLQQMKIRDLENQVKQLKEQLENTPTIIVNQGLEIKKVTRKRIVTQETKDYSDYKTNGIRKAHAADPIRSYDDFVLIQNYYLSKNRIRDWAMWTIGVALGFRVSDLLSLQFKNVIDENGKFKERIQIYEKKTGKLNNCLITEAVRYALSKYIEYKKHYDLNEYIFSSEKTGGKMLEVCGWRIISQAGKELNLPFNMGSHTMRKSFANIVACLDNTSVDMNAITKVQGLLNHSDQKSTMRYLNTFKSLYDKCRIAVSDFVMGKTEVNELFIGANNKLETSEELLNKLEDIQILLKNYERDKE